MRACRWHSRIPDRSSQPLAKPTRDTAQRFYAPFNRDGRRYYSRGTGEVRFFALDSAYMSPEQLQWIQEELSRSNEKWKISRMGTIVDSTVITRREAAGSWSE